MTIIRMPTDYASRKGAARIALGLLQARLDHCRTEAQRTDEILRERATEAGQSGSEHERVALEAAEFGMAYGYFAAVLEAEKADRL